MSPAELDAIEKRAEAATPGPWETDRRVRCLAVVAPALTRLPGLGHDYSGVVAFWSGASTDPTDPTGSWADHRSVTAGIDATFIAASRTDIPALLAHIRGLENDLDHWRVKATAYGGIVHGCSPPLAAAGHPVDSTQKDGAVGGIARAVASLAAERDELRAELARRVSRTITETT